MDEDKRTADGTDKAAAYAKKLRALVKRAREQGGATQKALAQATGNSETAVSRYLSGERLADREFVSKFAAFLSSLGCGLSDQELNHLHALRRAAQKARAGTQVLYLQEEVEHLQEELERLKALGRQDKARLADASRRLSDVGQQLADALERAETVKTERDELQEKVHKQRRQLDFASQYTRQIEDEQTEQREVVRRLLREVEVLRGQVRNLRDEPDPPSGQATSGAAAQASATAAPRSARKSTHGPSARVPGSGQLDDAIDAARQRSDASARLTRRKEERERRERDEVRALCAEAVARLRPHHGQTFVHVEPQKGLFPVFGDYVSMRGKTSGTRYRKVKQQRCWLIKQTPTVILLLENGSAGWFRHVEVFEPRQDGVYVSTGLAPIDEYPFITRYGESIPAALKRYLGEAILRYERGLG